MEVAKLILDLVKAVAWPLVTIILVLRFQSVLTDTFRGLNEKLRTAENLKFGVMGQEIELSGAAKELLKRSDKLVESGAPAEAQRAQESAERLRNPIADIVGIALFRFRVERPDGRGNRPDFGSVVWYAIWANAADASRNER